MPYFAFLGVGLFVRADFVALFSRLRLCRRLASARFRSLSWQGVAHSVQLPSSRVQTLSISLLPLAPMLLHFGTRVVLAMILSHPVWVNFSPADLLLFVANSKLFWRKPECHRFLLPKHFFAWSVEWSGSSDESDFQVWPRV